MTPDRLRKKQNAYIRCPKDSQGRGRDVRKPARETSEFLEGAACARYFSLGTHSLDLGAVGACGTLLEGPRVNILPSEVVESPHKYLHQTCAQI